MSDSSESFPGKGISCSTFTWFIFSPVGHFSLEKVSIGSGHAAEPLTRLRAMSAAPRAARISGLEFAPVSKVDSRDIVPEEISIGAAQTASPKKGRIRDRPIKRRLSIKTSLKRAQ